MTVKEVKVELTEADVKAESRMTATRKRRATKKSGGADAAPSTAPSATPETPTPAPAVSLSTNPDSTATTTVIKAASVSQVNIETKPGLPETSMPPTPPTPPTPSTVPATGGVRIKTRKRTHGSVMPPTPTPVNTRILPVKRHATPIHNEKPKLRIPTVGGQVPSSPVAAPQVPQMSQIQQQDVSKIQQQSQSQSQSQPQPQPQPKATTGGAAKSRRFTERRIGISLKQLKTTRKVSKTIRKRVKTMPIAEIRRILTEKGIIRGKRTPEEMLRSLMKDYLALKHE